MNLLAPNGNQTNLTKEQYFLVRTPEFKQWFGDWEKLALTKINDSGIDEISLKRLEEGVSKVVDENGEPLVVYHGTYVENPFYIFDFDKADIGFHFGTYEQAKNRAETKLFFKGHKSIINQFFLNIKIIFQVTDITEWEYPQRYLDMFMSDNIITEIEFKKNGFQFLNYKENNKQIRDFLIEKYNNKIGFEYNNKYEGEGKSYIVVEPNQIKLADGTNTTFDANNPDIRFEDGGLIDFTFEQLPDDYKEFYQIRGFKNLNDEKYYFSRLNTHTEKNVFTIETEDGKEIARATLNENGNYLTNIRVDENYRRKGLASNLYNFIEKVTNSNLKPSPDKISNEAKNLWMKRNLDIRFEKGGNVIINPKEIECQRCHWQWDVKKGGNDLFICHKCNFDNSKYYTFVDLKKPLTVENNFLKNGGKTISQTPAPKKDKIYGSDTNEEGSSKDLKSAKKIELSDTTIEAIKNKIEQHNEKYPNKKISIDSAKAVVRRGMGAYSSSHRPTITDNKPNNRVAWGLARLNAFTYKIINGKSKSGKYNQDDDLIKELNIRLETRGSIKQKTEMKEFKHKFNDGGNVPKSNKMFHLPLELVVYVPSTKDVDKIISKQEMKERVDEVKNYLGKAFGGYSSVKVEGGYVANDGDLVNESITKVVSFASKEDYEKNKNELVSKMTQWSEKWGQEAIGFEFEGDLYYVPEKLKKGGRISHPTFDKLKKKMIMKKGGGIYEGWGFNDRIKVLMKGTKSNILKSFKELSLLFPTDDKEIIQDKTIEIFINENELKKVKKIANYNNLTILYETGGEIDYSTGWNQDYENDPLVKAGRKAKELGIRAGMAVATEGGSEIARAEGSAVQKMAGQMQPQPGQTGQPDQNQMLMQMAQSGAFGKMAKGGLVNDSISYLKGGKNNQLSTQELKSLEVAFNRFADKERSVILKRGGLTSKQQNKISTVMHEFKQGELHSGSKKGSIVKKRKQAIAIALSEADVKRKRK